VPSAHLDRQTAQRSTAVIANALKHYLKVRVHVFSDLNSASSSGSQHDATRKAAAAAQGPPPAPVPRWGREGAQAPLNRG